MNIFSCQGCGQRLYFENTVCEQCGRRLGFFPDLAVVSALEPAEANYKALGNGDALYRYCINAQHGVCNWMVPARSAEERCATCRHNHTIPDLSVPENPSRWLRIENAKHRLFYTLIKLKLPLANKQDDPEKGLSFEFLAEDSSTHGDRVMIGHQQGVITMAVREADDAIREKTRAELGEPYRTLLGHFRHESGHYFWDRLIDDTGKHESFRAVFGDERTDYDAAVSAHYSSGPPANWQQNFVSAYASMHPWEDFAETWAHYLHIVDTLETARSHGVRLQASAGWKKDPTTVIAFDPHQGGDFSRLIDTWLPLTFAVNSLNRSMGQPDLYPFVLSPAAIAKLDYVHQLIHVAR
jgi:hypothetical protein